MELIEGNVVDMPFPDGAFDKVLCQFGVQYFPDRLAAMKEMRRVTAPGGRLVFNVFRSIEHNQGWVPLIEALDRHVGKDAGDIFRSIFAIKDPALIRTAAAQAGWRDVRVEIRVDAARYGSVRDLVRWELESMPTPALAEKLIGAGEDIVRDLEAAMLPHIADNGVVFPCECYVLEASK
jgi:SAM-dependent methyltransferase